MTTLDLTSSAHTGGGSGEPPDLQMRVKWNVVTAWLVAAMVGTNGYRIITTPENATGDAQAIKELRTEVSALSQRVAVMIAIVERVELQQRREQERDIDRTGRPSRQFDH